MTHRSRLVIQPTMGDADGRLSPSDDSTKRVAIDLICAPCWRRGRTVRLARLAVDAKGPDFRPDEVRPPGENSCLTITGIPTPDGSVRFRYKMLCPICGQSPIIRGERVAKWLKELLVRGGEKSIDMHRV